MRHLKPDLRYASRFGRFAIGRFADNAVADPGEVDVAFKPAPTAFSSPFNRCVKFRPAFWRVTAEGRKAGIGHFEASVGLRFKCNTMLTVGKADEFKPGAPPSLALVLLSQPQELICELPCLPTTGYALEPGQCFRSAGPSVA